MGPKSDTLPHAASSIAGDDADSIEDRLADRRARHRRVPAAPALAQSSGDETELAKKTQNPVADLISVPFQSNFKLRRGLEGRDGLRPQRTAGDPAHLNADWNLITRTIVPIINPPSLSRVPIAFPEAPFGLGDINPSLFLSQVWDLGPMAHRRRRKYVCGGHRGSISLWRV